MPGQEETFFGDLLKSNQRIEAEPAPDLSDTPPPWLNTMEEHRAPEIGLGLDGAVEANAKPMQVGHFASHPPDPDFLDKARYALKDIHGTLPSPPTPVVKAPLLVKVDKLIDSFEDLKDEFRALSKQVQYVYAVVTTPKKRGRPVGTTGIKKRKTVKKKPAKKSSRRG